MRYVVAYRHESGEVCDVYVVSQIDARYFLVFLLSVSISRIYRDVFIKGSFTQHLVSLPSNTWGGGDSTCTLFYLCLLFVLASCEANFYDAGFIHVFVMPAVKTVSSTCALYCVLNI